MWKGVHQDVVLSLEHQHVVEGSRDAQGHGVRERTLTEGVDEEDCRCSSDRSAVSNTDPRAHAQAVGEFPLTTHIGVDADEEVETTSWKGPPLYSHSSSDAASQ